MKRELQEFINKLKIEKDECYQESKNKDRTEASRNSEWGSYTAIANIITDLEVLVNDYE